MYNATSVFMQLLQLNAVTSKSTQDLYIKQLGQHAPVLAFQERGQAMIRALR
jgi:hypothetical protein